jgi:hypothetical protein
MFMHTTTQRGRRAASALAMVIVGVTTAAFGQSYTPGSGGSTYVPQYNPYSQQPSYQPGYQQPSYQQPSYQQPSYSQQPNYSQQPSYSWETPQQGYQSYTQQIQVPQLNDQQVADLTASVALYPDPLLAVMLPAATYPQEIVSANQWLRNHPNPDELTIQGLPYQPVVKTLLHYPSVLTLMADHVDWTQALGTAFVYQQNDVINSVQRWRATAQAVGTLTSTPEQQVVAQNGIIQIMPAAPQTVYVPVYDPQVVYVRQQSWVRRDPVIRFNVGGRFGVWLDNDLDWRDRVVRVPTRPYWDRPNWDRPRDRNDWNREWNRADQDRRNTVIDLRRFDDRNDKRPMAGAVIRRDDTPLSQQGRSSVVVTGNRDRDDDRRVFVRDNKAGLTYPNRIVTPQDRKVVTVPPQAGRGQVIRPDADGRAPGRGNADRRTDNR